MSPAERVISYQCIHCKKFKTDQAQAIDEQHRQMKAHLESVHPYWDWEKLGTVNQEYKNNFREVHQENDKHFCTACGGSITHEANFCPHCAASTQHIQATKSSQEREADVIKVLERKRTLGLVGSLVLFIGVFTPIISMPIVGSINYFQNGKGDGAFVLILAVVSLVFTLTKKYKGLWFTGIGSLGLIIFTFLNFQKRLSEMKEQTARDLSGNPFSGFADVAIQSIQIQWGWAVLIVGAGLVIAAAAIVPFKHTTSLRSPTGAVTSAAKVASNERRNVVLIGIGTAIIIALMFIWAYWSE